MAEIILKFKEDEFEDARTALDGWKWKMAMWDLDQSFLREQMKYNDELSEETYNAYEKVRNKITDILNDYNLNLE